MAHEPCPPDNLRPTRMIVAGGGGHALVVAEAAQAAGLRVVGFFDDNAGAPLGEEDRSPHAPRLGPLASFVPTRDRPGVLGIGLLGPRHAVLQRLAGDAMDASLWCVIVHPAAMLSGSARVGLGVFIAARAVVQTRATLGEHAIVNTGAIIEHECRVGRNVHIAPGAVVAGRCEIGDGSLIGVGAVLLPGVKIGRGCTVGAGALVRRDVPDGVAVVGVPAKAMPGERRGPIA